MHAREAGAVAARRAIDAVGPGGRDGHERRRLDEGAVMRRDARRLLGNGGLARRAVQRLQLLDGGYDGHVRSEEHTSELQSLMRISYAVFCLRNKSYGHIWLTPS